MIVQQICRKIAGFFNTSLIKIWLFSLLFKLFLVFSYKSVPYDKFTSILDITRELPLRQWYYKEIEFSPLFMYFQYFIARCIPKDVENAHMSMIYRKLSVIVSEFVLVLILNLYSTDKYNLLISASIILNPCLFLLDHIYYGYKGFVYGFLILSIIQLQKEKYLKTGFLFALTVSLNKGFICLIPCFGIVLIRSYCLNIVKFEFKTYLSLLKVIKWLNLLKLGSVIILGLMIPILPLVYQNATWNDFKQVYRKIFPSKSLLISDEQSTPNVWILYSFLDRVLTQMLKYFQKVNKFDYFKNHKIMDIIKTNELIRSKNTFNILPPIEPIINFYFTSFYQSLAIIPLFFNCNFKRFIGSLTLCCYSNYLFGRNIISTEILIIIIPFSFLIIFDKRLLTPFMLLTSSGIVSIFPLINSSELFLLKITYTTLWMIIFYLSFNHSIKNNDENRRVWFFDRLSMIYIVSLFPMIIVYGIFNTFEFKGKKYKHIALLIYNCYCSLGIITSWFGLSWLYNFDEHMWT